MIAANHGYDGVRLDLPFVGIARVGKYPIVTDGERIDANFVPLTNFLHRF